MHRDEVIAILETHRPELENRKIKSLSLFGSVARNEAGPESDVDLLVEFSEPVGLFEFVAVKNYLETALGRSVDLGTPRSVKRQLRERIMTDIVHAF